MRYMKHFMEDIVGIEVYPIISLLIFVAFFIGLAVYIILMRKSHVEYMSHRPLENNDDNSVRKV